MKTCPKCSYTRTAADAGVPDWQCPKCGIAYAKFEAREVADWEAKRASPAPATRGSSTALNMLIWVVAVGAFFALLAYVTPGGLKTLLEARSGRVAASGPGEAPLPVLRMSAEASDGLATISSARVVLFSAAWCPHCKTVRSLLERQGVRFAEFDIERDERAAAFQREKMPVVGFPVTVIGNQIVMGSDEGQILAALKAL